MYLGEAASLPPYFLVPNYPNGYSSEMLFVPQKFWARLMIVPAKDASPWW